MSALLGWLGGGTVASSLFVALNASLTYGAFAVLILRRGRPLAFWTLIAAVCIVNPVILCYVGIVWKDVLLATWVVTTFALAIIAERTNSKLCRGVLIVSLVALIAVGPLIRQQGLVMAPILLVAPLMLIYRSTSKPWRGIFILCALILFVSAWGGISAAANRKIGGISGRDLAVGPGVVAMFDISGIIARITPDEALRDVPGLSPRYDSQVRALYTATRADFLNSMPTFMADLQIAADGASVADIWRRTVQTHPAAYLRHRARVVLDILSFEKLNQCLPIHVGVDGRGDYQSALGLSSEQDDRQKAIYRFAAVFLILHYGGTGSTLLYLLCLPFLFWSGRISPIVVLYLCI